MVFVLHHDGTSTEYSDDCLLIFIDETGDENFRDSGTPFFGFGGCVCHAGNYSNVIEKPFKELEQHFPDHPKPLHAAELRPSALSLQQKSAIGSFFRNGEFGRFAAITRADFVNQTNQDTFHIAARCALQEIIKANLLLGGVFEEILIIFEHSQRLDRLYADYFRRYRFRRASGIDVPCSYATMAKSEAGTDFLAGLIVADFVAHTAGGVARRIVRENLSRVVRKDFDAVFAHRLATHFFVSAARVRS